MSVVFSILAVVAILVLLVGLTIYRGWKTWEEADHEICTTCGYNIPEESVGNRKFGYCHECTMKMPWQNRPYDVIG